MKFHFQTGMITVFISKTRINQNVTTDQKGHTEITFPSHCLPVKYNMDAIEGKIK